MKNYWSRKIRTPRNNSEDWSIQNEEQEEEFTRGDAYNFTRSNCVETRGTEDHWIPATLQSSTTNWKKEVIFG